MIPIKRIITITTIITLLSGTISAGINDGLIAWYPFNGNANDASGNENDGANNGATPTTDRFGTASSAYSFDGGDYINSNYGSGMQVNSFSYGVWAKSPSSNSGFNSGNFISSWEPHPNGVARIIGIKKYDPHSRDGQVVFEIHSTQFLSPDRYDDGNWHFFTMTYDGSIWKSYADGVLLNSETHSGSVQMDNNFIIGARYNATDGWSEKVIGDLDDIRIYNRALTEADIYELYHEGGWDVDPNEVIVADIDGNVYQTVKIGNQTWMAENLKVTHYRNGEAITKINNNTVWSATTDGAYCNYDNNDLNADTYGSLYNWFAVNDSRNIAPAGWHVPTDEEWKELEMYVGLSESEADQAGWRGTDEGNKLKSTSGWNNSGNGTDEFGFSVLPGGCRTCPGIYERLGDVSYFWSATEYDISTAWDRILYYDHSDVCRSDEGKNSGFWVRCVKTDTTYITGGTISTDSTWTKALSPYVISGDVVVDNGATLTIEPGVEVIFLNGVRFYSTGSTIHAVGTSTDSIRFKDIGGVYDGNFQIWVEGEVKFEYCIFENLSHGGLLLNEIDFNKPTYVKCSRFVNSNYFHSVDDTCYYNTFDRYSSIDFEGSQSQYVFRYNNIFISEGSFEARSGCQDIDAQFNYWGSSTTAEIESGDNPKNISVIRDIFDDSNRPYVDYSHWLDAPYPGGQPVVNSVTGVILLTDNQYTDEMLTYHSSDSIFFQITDPDRNTNDSSPEQITIEAWSETDTDHETVTLTETGNATAFFRGYIPIDDIGSKTVDGELQVSYGDWMYFQYIDPADDWGNIDILTYTTMFGATQIDGWPAGQDTLLLAYSGSPYLIQQDIVTPDASSTFIIEPGVTVLLGTDDSEMFDASQESDQLISILIRNGGKFICRGTESDSIYFLPAGEKWAGLFFTNDYAFLRQEIAYTNISKADWAISCAQSCGGFEYRRDSIFVQNSLITDSRYAITNVTTAFLEVINTNISNCFEGVYLDQTFRHWAPEAPHYGPEHTTIVNSEFQDIEHFAIKLCTANALIVGNDFDSNGAWIICIGCEAFDDEDIQILHNNFNIGSLTDGAIDNNFINDIECRYNYWGPTATTEMSATPELINISTIYDSFDDISRGTVDYSQFLDAPWPGGEPVFPDTTYITGGTITQDSTWTKALSPYVISGDVVVDNGATLTIEPGVEVLLGENVWIKGHEGAINAVGTQNDTIIFRNGTQNKWGGIQGPNYGGIYFGELKYCKIENATWAFYLDNRDGKISNSRILNCNEACRIQQEQTNAVIELNSIENCDMGIDLWGYSSAYIKYNTFSNNSRCIQIADFDSLIFMYNNFIYSNNAIYNIYGHNINAQNNYWGANATTEMNAGDNPKNISTIDDYYEDPNRGKVDYSHWLDAPWPGGQPVGDTYDAEMLITDNQYTDEMLTYHSGDSVFIQITDIDRNSDDIIPDQLTLDVWSETETTHETLTLNETDLATGIFRGWIKLDDATGVSFPDGQLQLSHGDWMYFQYIDPADDWGSLDTVSNRLLFDATIHPGGSYFTEDLTFYQSYSPYIVTGDVTFGQNSTSTLTIEPGTRIYFAEDQNDYGYISTPGIVWFSVQTGADLICEGTAQDSIWLMPYDEEIGWEGINIAYRHNENQNRNTSISYTNIIGAKYGIHRGGGGWEGVDTLNIDHCKFINCESSALYLPVAYYVSVTNTEIIGSSTNAAIHYTSNKDNSYLRVHHCVIRETHTNGNGLINISGNNTRSQIAYNDIYLSEDGGSPVIQATNYNRVDFNYNNLITQTGWNHIDWVCSNDMDARYNYWGETATTEINTGDNPKNISTIQDYFDDPNRGMVNYSRWLDAPWPDGTPAPGGYTGEMNFIYSDGSDAWGYNEGDTLYIKLYDPDLNTDINTPEYATVEVWSQLETVPELLNLNEVDADTGLFIGWMLLDGQTGFAMTDGVLQVDQGNQVYCQYTDALDDWNNQNTTTQDSITYDFRIREYEPDENTVLLLHFNEGEGQTVVDYSACINHGTLGSSTGSDDNDPIWTTGISGNCLKYDGQNDYVMVNNSPELNLTDFTIDAFVKIDQNFNQDGTIISKENNISPVYWPYRVQVNGRIGLIYLDFTVDNRSTLYSLSSKESYKDNTWHHIRFTRNDSIKKVFLFIDEQIIDSLEYSGNIDTNEEVLGIGLSPYCWSMPFKGMIEELRISNIARTSFDDSFVTENPPGKINDLAVTDSTSLSITLQWHAPGADSYTGTCELYDLRMSTSPIDSANFISATPVSCFLSPASAGTLQSFMVDSLNYATTYYFALKAKDDEGLWSPISNVVVGHTEPKDETPPGTVSDLAQSSVSKRSAIITWTAPADDGQSGRPISGYTVYYATFPINGTNFMTADSLAPLHLSPLSPGVAISDTLTNLLPNTLYYAAVRSYDEVPNWSALSNVLQLTTEAVPVIADVTFPMNAYDAQRSRSVPYNGATLGTFRWTFNTGAAVSSSPVIDTDGTVYVGSEDGKIYAVDPGGNELWNKSLGAGIFAAPCIGTENHLFVSCKNNKVYALNKANGDTLWTYTTGGQIYSSPVISSFGYLYVGSLDNKVYALTSDAGDLVWTFTGSGKFYASPALTIDESKLIIGDQSGKLYALNPHTGEKLWEYPANSAIYANAAVDSTGNVYFGAQNGNLYCLSSTGAYKWDYNTGGAIFYASPTIGYGSVSTKASMVNDATDMLKSFKKVDTGNRNQETGKGSKENSKLQSEEHAAKFPNPNFKSPISNLQSPISNLKSPSSGLLSPVSSISVSSAQMVYIGSDGQKLHAVNASTGANIWSYTTLGNIRNGAVLSANGYLYFGSSDDSLYCIKTDGSRRWAYKTGGDLYTSNPAMGLDGAVYIGCYDNKLYAVGEYLEVVDPVIVSTYPAINSCTMPVDTTIRVKFNTIINMFTVDDNTFHVTGKQHGRYSGSYSWDSADSAVVFTSDDDFFYGEEISVLLTDGIRSVSGEWDRFIPFHSGPGQWRRRGRWTKSLPGYLQQVII